jgi:hypothetical protein
VGSGVAFRSGRGGGGGGGGRQAWMLSVLALWALGCDGGGERCKTCVGGAGADGAGGRIGIDLGDGGRGGGAADTGGTTGSGGATDAGGVAGTDAAGTSGAGTTGAAGTGGAGATGAAGTGAAGTGAAGTGAAGTGAAGTGAAGTGAAGTGAAGTGAAGTGAAGTGAAGTGAAGTGAAGTGAGGRGGLGGAGGGVAGGGGGVTGGRGGAAGGPGGAGGLGGAGGMAGAAQVIASIDFVGGTPATGGHAGATITPAPMMAATEIAGVKAASNWNAATGREGSRANLVQSNGVATTASVSWSASDDPGVGTYPYTDMAGNVRMMNGYLDAGTGTATITVSALPASFTAAGYDVYVYVARGNTLSGLRTFELAIATTTLTAGETGPTSATFSGFTLAPAAGGEGNYVIFRNLRSASFTLTANPGTGMHAPVNGLQIVAPSGS